MKRIIIILLIFGLVTFGCVTTEGSRSSTEAKDILEENADEWLTKQGRDNVEPKHINMNCVYNRNCYFLENSSDGISLLTDEEALALNDYLVNMYGPRVSFTNCLMGKIKGDLYILTYQDKESKEIYMAGIDEFYEYTLIEPGWGTCEFLLE